MTPLLVPGRPRTPFDRRYISYCARMCISVYNGTYWRFQCAGSLKFAVQSMVGHLNFSPLTPPATLPVNMQMSNEKYYCFWKRKMPKTDICKSRKHRIPWPHPVFFAKAAHKLDCPIIAHLRIFLVVVVYSYCLVFIVNNFENVGSLKWPIFTFLIINIERIKPFFL